MAQRASLSPYLLAEVAESVAFTMERVAATYRRMAKGANAAKTARLLGHVARLEGIAEHERAEAVRLRQIVNTDG